MAVANENEIWPQFNIAFLNLQQRYFLIKLSRRQVRRRSSSSCVTTQYKFFMDISSLSFNQKNSRQRNETLVPFLIPHFYCGEIKEPRQNLLSISL